MAEMILAEGPAIARVNRWWQLGWGLVCMMAISSSQCMDIVHDAFNRAFKCDVGRGPGDLLGSDRFADVFIAFSRLSGGRFWPARPSLNWRNAYGSKLGVCGRREKHLRALPSLTDSLVGSAPASFMWGW